MKELRFYVQYLDTLYEGTEILYNIWVHLVKVLRFCMLYLKELRFVYIIWTHLVKELRCMINTWTHFVRELRFVYNTWEYVMQELSFLIIS
jgi:hypothetical protein